MSDDDVIKEIPEEILKKILEVKKDEVSKFMETAEQSKEDEDLDDEEKKKEGTQSEACMSKFYDAVAHAESKNNGHVIPSIFKSAERIIKSLVDTVSSNKAVNITIKEVGFYGMNKSKTVAMGKRGFT